MIKNTRYVTQSLKDSSHAASKSGSSGISLDESVTGGGWVRVKLTPVLEKPRGWVAE